MSEPESKFGAGTVLDDRYELADEIARGGFGRVYRAEQLNMNREVAIKMVPPKYMDLPDVVQRFQREARLASRLSHPNTITVHDYGQHGNYLYLVMELLEGEDLADILARERQIELGRIAHIARQVLKSLNEAHQHNIIHRDLKPENIFLTEISGEQDFVKVVDFGIAKLAMSEMNASEDDTHRSLTVEGNTVGTPTYMSPEQAAGGEVDNRSDLYGLGVILYEMAAGRPPFDHEEPAKLMRMHIFQDIPQFDEDALRGCWLEPIVRRALAKEKEERFQDASEFIEALDYAVEAAENGRAFAPTEEQNAIELEDEKVPENDQESEEMLSPDSEEFFPSDGRSNTMQSAQSPVSTPSNAARTTSDADRSPISAPSKDQNTSSSILTVLEPSPDEDVIVLDEPKEPPPSEAESARGRGAPGEPRSDRSARDELEPSTSGSNARGHDRRDRSGDGRSASASSSETRNEGGGFDSDAPSDDSWSWEDSASVPGEEFDTELYNTATERQTDWLSAFVWVIVALTVAAAGYLYLTGQFG